MIFIDYFLPGYKAGGISQFIFNLSSCIKHDYKIYIVTNDHDYGESTPYPSVPADQWINDNGVCTRYLSKHCRSLLHVRKLLMEIQPDFVYLNSMFSLTFTIYPLLARAVSRTKLSKVVLAPNGMLQKPALQQKRFKKSIYLFVFKAFSFHSRIRFHACANSEAESIKAVFGNRVDVKVVPYFPITNQQAFRGITKEMGELRCLFLSRILPHKNLSVVLQVLASATSNIMLTIVGPIESKVYWDQCTKLIEQMPANIKVHYAGEQPHELTKEFYLQNHLFILPTKSESFGQVIFDSFLYGRPVIISDQTPWRNLEAQKVGWDLPLNDYKAFTDAVDVAANLPQEQYDQLAFNCWNFAKDFIEQSDLRVAYNRLFSSG
jgi:glycosyltransferase involved in cell wall biosynthesis